MPRALHAAPSISNDARGKHKRNLMVCAVSDAASLRKMAKVLSGGCAKDVELEKHEKGEIVLMLDDVICCVALLTPNSLQAMHSGPQLSRPRFYGRPTRPYDDSHRKHRKNLSMT
jgi:hypothetical protein